MFPLQYRYAISHARTVLKEANQNFDAFQNAPLDLNSHIDLTATIIYIYKINIREYKKVHPWSNKRVSRKKKKETWIRGEIWMKFAIDSKTNYTIQWTIEC